MNKKIQARNYRFPIDTNIRFETLNVRVLTKKPATRNKNYNPMPAGYSQALSVMKPGESFYIQTDFQYSGIESWIRNTADNVGVAIGYVRLKDGGLRIVRINDDLTLPWATKPVITVPARAEATLNGNGQPLPDNAVMKVTGVDHDSKERDQIHDNVTNRKRMLFSAACAYGDDHQKACLYEDAKDVSSDRRAIIAAFVAGFAFKARLDATVNSELSRLTLGKLRDDLEAKR